MINPFNIFKNIRPSFKKSRASSDKRFTNPRRDWFTGIALFIVLVAIGAGFSAKTFVEYRNLNTDGGDYNESLVRYNENLINEVVRVYEERKTTYDSLRSVVVPEIIVPEVVVDTNATSSASTTATTSQEIIDTEEQGTSTPPVLDDEVILVN